MRKEDNFEEEEEGQEKFSWKEKWWRETKEKMWKRRRKRNYPKVGEIGKERESKKKRLVEMRGRRRRKDQEQEK